MKKHIITAFFLTLPLTLFAQEDTTPLPQTTIGPVFEEERIIPEMKIPSHIALHNEASFDASSSRLMSPSSGQANYAWDFGDDSPLAWGSNVRHTYTKPGLYTVKLKVSQGRRSESLAQEIIVYDRIGTLITDSTDPTEILYQAGTNGIHLRTITYESGSGFSSEEDFIRRLQENVTSLSESEIIIFYTSSTRALQNVGQWWQKLSEENRFNIREKLWVQILAEGSLTNSRKSLQPVFSILKPNFILLTRPSSLNILFKNVDPSQALKIIEQRRIENVIVDERSATSKILILSNLTSYFVTNGISQNVIYLLLAVPMIAFIIAFFRQFVGISTFGVYTPLMLSLSFLILGFWFGLFVFLSVMIVSYIIRLIFEKVDLLYIPKVSLLFSVLSILFFFVLGLAIYFETPINLTLTIFPMLMMVSLSEKFISTQSSSGMFRAFLATAETIVVSLIGYIFVVWEWVQSSIISIPELILIPLIGTIWLGTFTGLRISEYIKFRTLFQEDNQEE